MKECTFLIFEFSGTSRFNSQNMQIGMKKQQSNTRTNIREQWYYNNGHQKVVTSLQNSLDSSRHQEVLLESSVFCSAD